MVLDVYRLATVVAKELLEVAERQSLHMVQSSPLFHIHSIHDPYLLKQSRLSTYTASSSLRLFRLF
jgi:hypothetical protein